MASDPTRWYSSKIDPWLVPVLGLPPVAVAATFVAFALAGSTTGLLASAAVAALVAALYLGLIFPIRYGLGDGHLVVRFGLCRQRIPLPDITEVNPISSPLSAPALSLDRLRVQCGPGFFSGVTISPADRSRFLDELAQKAALTRDGDRLSRA